MCVCLCVWYPDAVFVAVSSASWTRALLLGEDYDVLIEEDAPHTGAFPPSPPAHHQLAVPYQLATLRRGHLKTRITHTHTHT